MPDSILRNNVSLRSDADEFFREMDLHALEVAFERVRELYPEDAKAFLFNKMAVNA